MKADEIVELMAAHAVSGPEQRAQTRYRMALAKQWRIPPGARVLEIACGQGDMTAVLANAVGPDGHVTAIDIAEPSYGAPISLADSAAHLLAGPLGPRLAFRFQTDLLDPAVDFPADAFDLAVLAHGAWYFQDMETLARVLRRIRPWATRLCFAEWDLAPDALSQVPHLLAVVIQGQIELHKTGSESNVRTPFSRARFLELLAAAGWRAIEEAPGDTSELADAEWEIAQCLRGALPEAEAMDLPAKTRAFLASQGDLLRELAANPVSPLPSYVLTAERDGAP
ncbi:MAG: class I SAM-dependent methyltransferase [Thermomicrobiales bacterium]|nr:class I SAM-dependent methyltransferase [Thermomicrobiales bacterium]